MFDFDDYNPFDTLSAPKEVETKLPLPVFEKRTGFGDISRAFDQAKKAGVLTREKESLPTLSFSSLSAFYKGLRAWNPTPYKILEYWFNSRESDKAEPDYFVIGKALETMVCGGLEGFRDEFRSYEGRINQKIKDECAATGKVAIKKSLESKVHLMHDALFQYEPFLEAMSTGSLTMQNDKKFQYEGIDFVTIPDLIWKEGEKIIAGDIKTTAKVSEFPDKIWKDLHYWIQAVICHLCFDLHEFRFIVVQSTAPYFTHQIIIERQQLEQLEAQFHNKVLKPFCEHLESGFWTNKVNISKFL